MVKNKEINIMNLKIIRIHLKKGFELNILYLILSFFLKVNKNRFTLFDKIIYFSKTYN